MLNTDRTSLRTLKAGAKSHIRTLSRKRPKLYADAARYDKSEIASFVRLFALIGRMRVLSRPKVVETAESVTHAILKTYQGTKKTVLNANTVSSDTFDPFREFREACRDELRSRGLLF
jgi:hypothetical protein